MIFRNIFNTVEGLPHLSNDGAWVEYLSGKGYAVNARSALRIAAVIRCVDVVAKTIASLPMNLFEKGTDGNRTKAEKHPVYNLLNRLPNRETTAYDFWHMYLFNLMLTPGAYAKIVRDRNGFIKALWNIPSARVSLKRNAVTKERYLHVYLDDGLTETLYEGDFMYTPGTRFSDATNPEDPIKLAADVLGLTMALNGFAKDFFENGANLGGVIELPNELSEPAYARMKDDWQKTWAGIVNQHKTAILEGGAKLSKLDSKLSDAQALESRQFEVIEICRMFGVPPHKVFELDRATFSNIEEMNTEFVQEAIIPNSVRIEQTIYKDLLTEREQLKLYAKINEKGLLRGKISDRGLFYHNMRQDGAFSANDILDLEDMDRIPVEDGGDVRLVNGNMISLKNAENNLPKAMQSGGSSK